MPDNKSPEINPVDEKREVLELIRRIDALYDKVKTLPQITKDENGNEKIDSDTKLSDGRSKIETSTKKITINSAPVLLRMFEVNSTWKMIQEVKWYDKFSKDFFSGLKYRLDISGKIEENDTDKTMEKSILGSYYLSQSGEMIKINSVGDDYEASGKVLRTETYARKDISSLLIPEHFEAVGLAVQILDQSLDNAGKQS